jgi:hypothetical protein
MAPTIELARYAAMVQDTSGAKWCSALNYSQISIGWMRVGAIRRRFARIFDIQSFCCIFCSQVPYV